MLQLDRRRPKIGGPAHQRALILSVKDAHEVGRMLTDNLFNESPDMASWDEPAHRA